MRMRLLVGVTTILLAGTAWAQQMCPNPNVCAGLPAQCCQQGGGDLVYECSQKAEPPFALADGAQINLTTPGGPASFSVAGKTVNNLVIGNATFPPFTIGSSANNARFATSDGGQCVAVGNFSGFVNPGPIVVEGRALTLSKSNPFYCRTPTRGDVICFQVKGQVGPPFPALTNCTPDRVEYACGTVM
jgi:hypothetical protein